MKQIYTFSGEEPIEFDDSKSVKELIEYAFDKFGYYEPFGMDIVTLFQCHHPETNTGWFTTDVKRSCAEEIKTPEWLCFAYHKPGVFYFAEGGWGHHMISLGNHPHIEDPVSLKLRFEDFNNSVVIAGKYTFMDIIKALKKTEYIPEDASYLVINAINPYKEAYIIRFSDEIMSKSLVEFKEQLPLSVVIIDIK